MEANSTAIAGVVPGAAIAGGAIIVMGGRYVGGASVGTICIKGWVDVTSVGSSAAVRPKDESYGTVAVVGAAGEWADAENVTTIEGGRATSGCGGDPTS